MRFLIAGGVLLLLGLSLAEYTRRNPQKKDTVSATDGSGDSTGDSAGDAKGDPRKKWPKAMATLLELDAPGTDSPAAPAAEFTALLGKPTDAALAGYAPLTGGPFSAHHLSGGFNSALFVMDAQGKSALVRVESGEAPKVLFVRDQPITALDVDGSTAFFASGGVVGATLARGGEPVTVRARFKNATVTSLAASGDTLVLTLMPKDADPKSTDAVGAVVSLTGSGELSLIASEVERPRAAQTDGKDAWWISSAGSLWRGALDGSFSSMLTDEADEPLALEGDALFFNSPRGSGPELRRIGRAGGNLQTLIAADVGQLTVTSGLVRFTTRGAGAGLLELTSGAEATKVLALPASGRGLAVGGTTVFFVTQGDDGRSVVWAK